ncbi:hypothetical protein WN944_001151 [Citrus x changshan-huyou]|uniref:Uncharacterized protein n=1 Tax=Citrus x changshan-huyou TaxID=2935761 RepID=A0AAP0MKF7_9ROSI
MRNTAMIDRVPSGPGEGSSAGSKKRKTARRAVGVSSSPGEDSSAGSKKRKTITTGPNRKKGRVVGVSLSQVNQSQNSSQQSTVTVGGEIKRKGPRIVRWKHVASSNINFGEVYSYLNEHLHQPSINASSITGTKEADHDTTSQTELQQSPVEDDFAADDYYESAHDSDDRHEPDARTKFRNDYFAQRLDRIECSIHKLRSELQVEHSSINELRSELQVERRDAQQYGEAVMGFMASFGVGSSKGAYGDSLFGRSYTAPDGYGPNADGGYGTNIDAGNDGEHIPMSLYSLYGDISGDNVQIFTEAPPRVSKFGHSYRPSYIFGSPYFIPSFKRVRNVRPLPALKITDYEIDERSSVDMNLLRGLEDSRLYEEFDQWFVGKVSVDRPDQES